MEFKSEEDIRIAEKIAQFPLLKETLPDTWNLQLGSEFNMTTDSYLFKTKPASDRLPLFEGKMMHQYTHTTDRTPRYWIDEASGRAGVLGQRGQDTGQRLDYEDYRLGFRDVARSTDERTLIATILPPKVFLGNTINYSASLSGELLLYLVACANSFVLDWIVRQKVSAHVNMFYFYQLPVPRLNANDPRALPLIQAAARLICTAPEFDDLAKLAGLRGWQDGVTDEAERAALRAELDGRVAALYSLSEAEYEHVLASFPLVKDTVKAAAMAALRRFA